MAASAFLTMCTSGLNIVIIRSGNLGAYLHTRNQPSGRWVQAYWCEKDAGKVVDVTGAGDAFLGGLAAGLTLSGGDAYQGMCIGREM